MAGLHGNSAGAAGGCRDGWRAPASWDRFWLVTWPLLGPTTLFVVTVTAIRCLRVFDTVADTDPRRPEPQASEVLLHLMYLEGFTYFRIGYSAAITTVFLAVVLALVVGTNPACWSGGCIMVERSLAAGPAASCGVLGRGGPAGPVALSVHAVRVGEARWRDLPGFARPLAEPPFLRRGELYARRSPQVPLLRYPAEWRDRLRA